MYITYKIPQKTGLNRRFPVKFILSLVMEITMWRFKKCERCSIHIPTHSYHSIAVVNAVIQKSTGVSIHWKVMLSSDLSLENLKELTLRL